MPNVIAHLGVGSVITRAFDPAADAKWIYLGCLIPDLPWIMQRIAAAAPLEVDLYDLKLYTTSLATLLSCVVLSSAVAVVTTAPGRIFLILTGNSVVHLLLDACQTKWGQGGVHLFAPLNWTPLNFELFWPESIITAALTLFGLVYCIHDLIRRRRSSVDLALSSRRRVMLCLTLLVGYVTLPLMMMRSAYLSDCHFVRTLVESQLRPGRPLELDRARYRTGPDSGSVTTYGREQLRVDLQTERAQGKVSIRGVFVDPTTIDVLEHHEHWPVLRQLTSVIGIGLVLCAWLIYVWGNKQISDCAVPAAGHLKARRERTVTSQATTELPTE